MHRCSEKCCGAPRCLVLPCAMRVSVFLNSTLHNLENCLSMFPPLLALSSLPWPHACHEVRKDPTSFRGSTQQYRIRKAIHPIIQPLSSKAEATTRTAALFQLREKRESNRFCTLLATPYTNINCRAHIAKHAHASRDPPVLQRPKLPQFGLIMFENLVGLWGCPFLCDSAETFFSTGCQQTMGRGSMKNSETLDLMATRRRSCVSSHLNFPAPTTSQNKVVYLVDPTVHTSTQLPKPASIGMLTNIAGHNQKETNSTRTESSLCVC